MIINKREIILKGKLLTGLRYCKSVGRGLMEYER